MNRNKKKKNNNKNQSKKVFSKVDHNRDLLGFILIGYALLSFISLFSDKMGIFGGIINSTSFTLIGIGAYILPTLIFSIGVILLMDRFNNSYFKNIVSLSIIYISILILLDRVNLNQTGFLNHITNAFKLSSTRSGAGILGSFFGFFFYRLFGTIGTYIVLIFINTINIMILTGTKIKEIIEFFNSKGINVINKAKKQKINVSKAKETEILNDISINDYNLIKDIDKELELDSRNQGKEKKSSDSKIKNKSKMEANIIDDLDEKSIMIHDYIYKVPPMNLLKSPTFKSNSSDKKEILSNAKKIEETINNFGIGASVSNINKGPAVTCYELLPDPGIKLSRIVSLSDNIALSLATSDIRIEAPIPGKAAIGIEVPNKIKENVLLKEIINTGEYRDMDSDLPLALGKDISGTPVVSSIEKMPHLLIAGATGSGKSVCINTIIMSLIYKSSPADVKLLLIDPKVVELNIYNGIPHLLIPVVTEAKKSASALNWAVQEMERRYKIFAKNNVRDITSYNHKIKNKDEEERLPKIVIIIDELADLMMVAAHEIEDYICRLAQMARAAGMHLIVATQRPSVDVITGTIKANIPSRISFAVSSQVDSRTILDMSGAEKLLGKGDMLFYPSFYNKPARLQGAFITDDEVEDIVEFLKAQELADYDEDIIETVEETTTINTSDSDELLPEAIKLVVNEGQASISLLQRRLRVGYARAARLVDEMELRGIVGGYEGSKPRKVLIDKEDLENLEGDYNE